MKKAAYLYLVLAVIAGVLIGYVLFSGTAVNEEKHDHSTEMASGELWTCSMHPQILQPEPGDCPICGMELIPVDNGIGGLSPAQISLTDHALALANIRTMIVGAAEGEGTFLKLSGKIQENQEATSVQASYFEGRIEKLYLNTTGETVTKGQLLASIFSPQLVAAQQELLTAKELKSSQPELYNAVRNKLKLWKLSENQINAIEANGKVKENFPVHATVSGTVTDKMVQEGDYIKQGQPLFKIADLNSVWAVFDAYENQLASLKKGQEIKITTNAFPNTEISGKIHFIDPVLNTRKRTAEVRVVMNNNAGLLKPGMFVSGKLAISKPEKTSGIMVPATAVMWTGERSLVYVKPRMDAAIFEMREVSLGPSSGEQVMVLDGLVNGEEIVVNGTFTVDAAAQLQGKKSMMNKSGGKTSTGHEGHFEMQIPVDTEMKISKQLQEALNNFWDPYLLLKDALISGSVSQASEAAHSGLEILEEVSISKQGNMENLHLGKATQMLRNIKEEVGLDAQRTYFVVLNEHLVPLGKGIENPLKTMYIMQCPMANNNQGALWISLEKEVKNPYYGEAMLSCGSIVDTIK